MAQRSYVRNTMSLEKNPVNLYARITIAGSSGAATLVSNKCQGIYNITRNSAGNYTLKLGLSSTSQDRYQRLMNFNWSVQLATLSAVAGCQIIADNSASSSNASVQIAFVDFAGAAVDPEDTAVLLLNFTLSNTTAV